MQALQCLSRYKFRQQLRDTFFFPLDRFQVNSVVNGLATTEILFCTLYLQFYFVRILYFLLIFFFTKPPLLWLVGDAIVEGSVI